MAFYTVSDSPANLLSRSELQKELDDIKCELISIEGRIAEKKAWAAAGQPTDDYLGWRAKSLNFRSRLISRYMVLKPLLKHMNRNRNE
jgi:hypothetical protein